MPNEQELVEQCEQQVQVMEPQTEAGEGEAYRSVQQYGNPYHGYGGYYGGYYPYHYNPLLTPLTLTPFLTQPYVYPYPPYPYNPYLSPYPYPYYR